MLQIKQPHFHTEKGPRFRIVLFHSHQQLTASRYVFVTSFFHFPFGGSAFASPPPVFSCRSASGALAVLLDRIDKLSNHAQVLLR